MYCKILKSLAAVLLIFSLVFACACNGGKDTSSTAGSAGGDKEATADYDFDKVYGGYDEPITVKIGVCQRDTEADYQNNAFIRILKEEYNINVEFEWILPWDQHMEKLNMSINAGTIPDAAIIYSADQVKELLASDSLLDINTIWDYLEPEMKAYYASFDNNRCLNDVSYNGKLGALPSTAISYQHELLWVRKDWLDVLGLDEPETLDDVIEIAKAFVNQDPDQNGKNDTFGIPFSSYAFGVDNSSGSVDPIFAAYNSYPAAWLTDSDGKIYYGSTAPETKAALTKLAELFQSRVIFCSEDNSGNRIGAGKTGLIFAPWYAGDILKSSFEQNPEAEWIALSAPLNDKGEYTVPAPQAALDVNGHLIIGKNAEHPEAILKIKNLYSQFSKALMSKDGECLLPDEIVSKFKSYFEEDGTEELPNMFWQQIGYKDAILKENTLLSEAVEKADTSKFVNEVQEKQYKNILAWQDDPTGCTSEEWQDAVNLMIGIPAAASKKYKEVPTGISVLPNELKTTYTEIQKTEQTFFYDIITGIKTPDAFENFVSNFKSMGGDKIIEQLNSSK